MSSRTWISQVFSLAIFLAGAAHAAADNAGGVPGWPRDYDSGTQRIEVYQPQIESWEGNRIGGRAAVALGDTDQKSAPIYGVAYFSAQADTDKAAGTVHLSSIEIQRVEVPTAPQEAERVRSVLQGRLPSQGMTTSIDQLQTSYVVARQLRQGQGVTVKNDVPAIVFAQIPTLLVHVQGEPVLRPVPGASSYQRVLNSQALILIDDEGRYYLNAAGYWYKANELRGPWRVTTKFPQSLLDAAAAAQKRMKADAMLPADGKPASKVPDILVATQPTELIVTDGAPQLTPIAGVALMWIGNADHALIVDPATSTTYALISGRWFRSQSLNGPWSHVSSASLPPEFARIPADSPQANVLVSVPGTPQAHEAVIAAGIPQTTTVVRSKAKLNVSYDGTPVFKSIMGTTLTYAANAPVPVIGTDSGAYYALSNGIWFVAASANGPWRVADSVPDAIYAIPVASPLHYVTYVHVYGATPDTVIVGYTPGYMGVIVTADGTVVYGTGYAYAPYVGDTVVYGYPDTYGYGASFAVGLAFGFAMGAWWGAPCPWWGPYWGWGGGFQYVNINHANIYGRWGSGTVTRGYGFNAWTGNRWAGGHAAGFNPYTGAHFQGGRGAIGNAYTGNYAAGRQGSFSDPSTGRSGANRAGIAGNAYTGNYAAGRAGANYDAQTGTGGAHRATVSGNVYDGTANVNRQGFEVNRNTGNGVAWNNGNVYVGHDGNVYEHSQDSGWQKHTDGGWQPANSQQGEVRDRLDQERQARDLGRQRMSNAPAWHPQGGGFGGGLRRGGGFHLRR